MRSTLKADDQSLRQLHTRGADRPAADPSLDDICRQTIQGGKGGTVLRRELQQSGTEARGIEVEGCLPLHDARSPPPGAVFDERYVRLDARSGHGSEHGVEVRSDHSQRLVTVVSQRPSAQIVW